MSNPHAGKMNLNEPPSVTTSTSTQNPQAKPQHDTQQQKRRATKPGKKTSKKMGGQVDRGTLVPPSRSTIKESSKIAVAAVQTEVKEGAQAATASPQSTVKLSKRWLEILRYEVNLYLDVEILLQLKSLLLEYFPQSSHKEWHNFCDLYEKIDATQSLLLHIWAEKNDDGTLLTQEKRLEDFSKQIARLTQALCKEGNNYLDRVAGICTDITKNQDKHQKFLQKNNLKLTDLTLKTILPQNICSELEEKYPIVFKDMKDYLEVKVKDFLGKIIILPAQYIAKLPLLFQDLKNDAKGFVEEKQVEEIQKRIAATIKGANAVKRASEYGSKVPLSMARELEPDTVPKQRFLNLNRGISYIFQIIAYYMEVEANKNDEITAIFEQLLTKVISVFINLSRTAGAVGTLTEELQNIPITKLSHEMRQLVTNCIKLLEDDSSALGIIDPLLQMKLKTAKKILTIEEADLCSNHAIIHWVIKEIKNVRAYIKTDKTLPPVQSVTQFFFRIAETIQESGLILSGLRLKLFKEKLEKLLTHDYEQLVHLMNTMELPFQKNIAHLIIYLFAETSQCCGIKLSFVSVELMQSLMTFLEITKSFQKKPAKSSQQLMLDAYLDVSPANKFPCDGSQSENKKNRFLCMFNMLHIVNDYYKYNGDAVRKNNILHAKKMILKVCFELRRNANSELPKELKSLIQVLTPYTNAADKSWLIPLLINFANEKLLTSPGAPILLISNNVNGKDALHYLYRSIIQQCSFFFVDYMESISKNPAKRRITATSKQRYSDECCIQLEALYQLSLNEMKQKISEVAEPYPKSIIGLLKSEFPKWEVKFDAEQRRKIMTKGEITTHVIPIFHAYLDELQDIVSPKQEQQAAQEASATTALK